MFCLLASGLEYTTQTGAIANCGYTRASGYYADQRLATQPERELVKVVGGRAAGQPEKELH